MNEVLDFSQQHYDLSTTIMPILQMRKPRLREIKWLGQEHIASLVLKMELKKKKGLQLYISGFDHNIFLLVLDFKINQTMKYVEKRINIVAYLRKTTKILTKLNSRPHLPDTSVHILRHHTKCFWLFLLISLRGVLKGVKTLNGERKMEVGLCVN